VLYLELDPHPGGCGSADISSLALLDLVAIVCMVCAVLRGLSAPHSAERERVRRDRRVNGLSKRVDLDGWWPPGAYFAVGVHVSD
jgi:hypothetical protein